MKKASSPRTFALRCVAALGGPGSDEFKRLIRAMRRDRGAVEREVVSRFYGAIEPATDEELRAELLRILADLESRAD